MGQNVWSGFFACGCMLLAFAAGRVSVEYAPNAQHGVATKASPAQANPPLTDHRPPPVASGGGGGRSKPSLTSASDVPPPYATGRDESIRQGTGYTPPGVLGGIRTHELDRANRAQLERAVESRQRQMDPSSHGALQTLGPGTARTSSPTATESSRNGTSRLSGLAPETSSGRAGNPTLSAEDKEDAECLAKLRRRGLLPRKPCIDIDKIIDDLARGEFTFSTPKRAYVGENLQIVLALKTHPSQNTREMFFTASTESKTVVAPYSHKLFATLRGIDFKIDRTGPIERVTTSHGPSAWTWSATPLKEGDKSLTIEVEAEIELSDSQKTRVQVQVLNEPITIRIGLIQWVKATVDEAMTAVVAVAGGLTAGIGLLGSIRPVRRFVYRVFRRKRARQRRSQIADAAAPAPPN